MNSPGLESFKKSWGEMRVYCRDAQSIVMEARVVKGGFCSVHHHGHHSNTFVVIRGKLIIGLFRSDGVCYEAVKIFPGQGLTIPANQEHQFYADEETIFLEWSVLHPTRPGQIADLEDIIRRPGHHLGGVTLDYPYKNVPHV